jgi:hypothetical protein
LRGSYASGGVASFAVWSRPVGGIHERFSPRSGSVEIDRWRDSIFSKAQSRPVAGPSARRSLRFRRCVGGTARRSHRDISLRLDSDLIALAAAVDPWAASGETSRAFAQDPLADQPVISACRVERTTYSPVAG